ncbi:proton channel OtopLc-like [Gigantopelta aegis]|uniref:proton channel OtopLc-like n=1 Tax=Gigantopelta aegis TaxID=1735272 RepID=UPI001B88E60B|nr:proton channel OtopLc-like [Gigantopelta aegis]
MMSENHQEHSKSKSESGPPDKENGDLENKNETSTTLNSEFTSSISGSVSESGFSRDASSSALFMFDTPPTTPILKTPYTQQPENNPVSKESIINSISVHVSALYAMLIVILGAVIQISNPFTMDRMPWLGQGFYIYLFLGSVVFLLFLYVFILRTNSCSLICKKGGQYTTTDGNSRNRLNRNLSFDHSTVHAGSFYLRLGAVAFGIGSMIMSGLSFGEYFESNIDHRGKFIYGARPVIQFVFTFCQLYFVFLHSKICVKSFKIISRFGFMHMIATNLCVWLGNIVDETLHEIHESEAHSESHSESPGGSHIGSHSTSGPILHLTLREVKNGSHVVTSANKSTLSQSATLQQQYYRRDGLMGSVVVESSPYLYPCSIEYSLICAAVLYVMWTNIGRKGVNNDREEMAQTIAKSQRLSLDCTNSNKGFFLGILFLVATVINVITFFILVDAEDGSQAAMMLEYLFEMMLYIVTSVAVILAFYQMRDLKFIPGVKMDLEQNLIILALAGIYIFSLFSIIAGSFLPGQTQSMLIILSSVMRMFQATIQTVFMLHSIRRCAQFKQQEKTKPGRETVTFLLMVNIGMWIINSFEVQQSEANPVQIDFYGILPWNIFAHISSPLAIFYRFHSTVCLSNVWKHAWKRKHGHGHD